ncbi:MAG: nitrogen regulation protein NR(II), partial [Dehalococcoidia bacterium]
MAVALAVYFAAGYVDVASAAGAVSAGLAICAAVLTVLLATLGADHGDRRGRAWALIYGGWAVAIGALVAADTGEAGAVSPAAWLFVVLFAIASRQFGRAYLALLSVAAASLIPFAEAMGDFAGYAPDYAAASFLAFALLATGLLFAFSSGSESAAGAGRSASGRLSARRLEEAARGSTAAIALFDQAGRVRFASPALERWLGEGALRLQAPAVVDGDDLDRALERALAGQPGRVEFKVPGMDGRVRDVDGVVFPLDEGAGLVAIDVTDVREVQTHLPRIQRMETLGLVAGGLAHDFNNLLTVVRGNLEVMGNAVGEFPGAKEVLAETTNACERASSVLRRLLDYARPRELSAVPVPVAGLLEETAALARGLLPPSVELEVESIRADEIVRADPGALQQVLLNLIVNSRDAMPSGGLIAVRAGPADEDLEVPARWRAEGQGPYRVIAVRDSGPGMDPETLARA